MIQFESHTSETLPSPSPAPAAMELEDVSVTLGSQKILHDLSVTIAQGEFVTLLGANGSGKSTLLRASVGILPLSAGRVSVFGKNVSRRSAHSVIGYVPQYSAESSTIPATARETVATGLLSSRRLRTSASASSVMEALDHVGMAEYAHRPITNMSGGQRQRVMIARALVRQPKILVLDEPFSGVDLASQKDIADIFRRLNEQGTTLLIVLHSLGELAHQLSRAVILDEGRIIYDGAPLEAPHGTIGHEHDHDIPTTSTTSIGQEMNP